MKEARSHISDLQGTSASQQVVLTDHSDEIQKLKKEMEKTGKRFESLEQALASQGKTIENQEKNLTSLTGETHHISQICEGHDRILKEHSDEISLLKKYLAQGNSSSTPSSFSLDIIENLEKKIISVDSKHTSLSESLNSRVSDLESILKAMKENISKNTEEIMNLKKKVQSLDEKIDQKLDISDFEKFKALRPSGDPGSISSQYLNMLEELQREVELIKAKLGDLPGFRKSLESLSKRVTDLEEKMKNKAETSELLRLLGNIKQPDGKDPNIPYILQKLIELEQKIDALLKLSSNPNTSSDAELWNLYKELRTLLDLKANLTDLKSLEDRLQDKVIVVCEAMGSKFADRIDTKKALKYLESLIREFIESGIKRPTGDDAMFAKKPLGGWSCASCETNLDKLKGMAAAYYSWNKMPYRDPNDRIARAGPGFSRMLATIQPEALASRVRTAQVKPSPQIDDDFPIEHKTVTVGKKPIRPMSAYHH